MILFLLALVSFKRNAFWVNVKVPYLSKQFYFVADEAVQAEKQELSPETETPIDSEGVFYSGSFEVNIDFNEMFFLSAQPAPGPIDINFK